MRSLFQALLLTGLLGWRSVFGADENLKADESLGYITVCSTDVSTKPEVIPFHPGLTALAAIFATKLGEKPYLQLRRARLIRDGKVITVDLRKIRRDNGATDLKLQPGDIVQLDESIF